MGRISLVRTSAALGLFDGLHLGHRHVLERVREQEKNGLLPSVFTFAAESVSIKHGTALEYLYPTEQKCRLFKEYGIQRIYHPPFADICNMDGEEFVQRILVQRFSAAHVCCGQDFRFGRKAAWNVQDLQKFGEQYGFAVEIAEDVLMDGQPVSSSRIRLHLISGEIERANLLLGAPYTIEQTVTHGAQLGRTIGFPTINQVFAEGQLVPKFGVYATETIVDGVKYPSVTNIGMKPTVNYQGRPLAETHIIGFQGDLYGRTLQVRFKRFIRPEQRFGSVEELQAQLCKDMACAGKE